MNISGKRINRAVNILRKTATKRSARRACRNLREGGRLHKFGHMQDEYFCSLQNVACPTCTAPVGEHCTHAFEPGNSFAMHDSRLVPYRLMAEVTDATN